MTAIATREFAAHEPQPTWNRRSFAWALAGIVALIAGMHGRCITHGLFMDDHPHFKQLRECGWSLRELTDACRLELVGGIIDLWWMPKVTLRFFRPVSFALMKLTYMLSGWSAAAMHLASLLWHLAVCVLLLRLLVRLGTRPALAWGVVALFSIHPGHVATVQWIASQSELMVTTFTLAAVHCFARRHNWWGEGAAGRLSEIGAWVFFLLALGCRENAIMLPAVLLVAELHRRTKLRDVAFRLAPFALLAAAYLVLRTALLSDALLPPRPYVIPPSDPEFLRFIFDKTCYYLISQFLLVPCIPFGGVLYFRDHAEAFYGMTAGVMLILVLVAWAQRRRTAVWIGAAWLFFFMAPVLPAFESPHHLYLPGIGWALLCALGFQTAVGRRPAQPSRGYRVRYATAWTIGISIGCFLGMISYFAGLALDTAQVVEDRVVEEIATAPVTLHSGDTLYIANLPTIAHYLKLRLERRLGIENLRVVALTWSPRLLGNRTGAELAIADDHTLEMRVAGDRWFAGPLGAMVRKTIGKPLPVMPDAPVVRDDFRVELIEADADGIAAMRFVFAEPLSRAGVHLFWGSQQRWAYRVPIGSEAR